VLIRVVMRDHKITLFKAKENDLVVELAEKDAQLEELEVSTAPHLTNVLQHPVQVSLAQGNTSLAHQRAADSKTSKLLASSQDKQLARAQSDLEDARVEVTRLEERVESLETKVRGLKQREKEARAELDGWLREEKGKEGSVRLSACLWFSGVDVTEVDKEKRELQTAVRSAQSELQKKNDEFADVQEELSAFRESSKEREKALKAKYRAATEERERLASIEVRRSQRPSICPLKPMITRRRSSKPSRSLLRPLRSRQRKRRVLLDPVARVWHLATR